VLPRDEVSVVLDRSLRVRRTLRDGDASAGDERDEDEQEGQESSHNGLRSVWETGS
jgi:hypothetical protein